MSDPVLLFGIGATKAGTSWLYRYLLDHPDCALRSIKELHFFDTIDDRKTRNFYLRDLERKAEALEHRIAGADAAAQAEQMLHLVDLKVYSKVLKSQDEAEYLAYLEDERGGERVVGDITPAYGLLPVDRLAHMAGLRSNVRFIYLMRDPVDRLWSHVRMIAKRRNDDEAVVGAAAARILDRVLSGGEDHIAIRGDYRTVLEKLASAVEPGQSFVCTCEDLFAGDRLERLCAFLGIAYLPGDTGTKVHGGISADMRPEQKARAAEYLRPQYDFVAEMMGRLPPAWAANRAGV